MSFEHLQAFYDSVYAKLSQSSHINLETIDDSIQDTVLTTIKNISNEHPQYPEEVSKRVLHEFLNAGPLEPLLKDDEITEIMINGSKKIWFEKNGSIHKHPDHFLSELSFKNFIHRICLDSGVQVNLDTPFTNGIWKNFRLHIIYPPLTSSQTYVTLRRQPECPWTLSLLNEVNWASSEKVNLLRKIIQQKSSFLVVGPTGSGKTSVLNACLQEVDPHERIITIEDTDEIKLPNKLSAKLLTRVDPNKILNSYDQSDLLIQSLRMRPQRIIVGEVRGHEAKDMLMAFATGHSGGMCTLHADNARQALLRLEMLTQLGAPSWDIQAIRHLIYLSINYVVVLKNENKQRKLEGIYKITALDEPGFLLENVTNNEELTYGKA